MQPQGKVFQVNLDRQQFTFETGKLAMQASGAVTLRVGDTMVFAAATMDSNIRPNIDFLPLTVDYEERMYAGGRIPGSFFRREGRPSEDAILTARLTDRPLRPLFPKDLRNDVQVIIYSLSTDGGESHRHPGHQRRLGRPDGLRYPLGWSHRCRPRRARSTASSSSTRPSSEQESSVSRSAPCRQPRRHPDGRVRRKGAFRRRHGPGARLRSPLHPAADRSAGADGCRNRQAKAPVLALPDRTRKSGPLWRAG